MDRWLTRQFLSTVYNSHDSNSWPSRVLRDTPRRAFSLPRLYSPGFCWHSHLSFLQHAFYSSSRWIMSDTGSIRSASRTSTLLNRPSIAPVGPRTRQSSLRISNVLGDDVTSPSESLTTDLPEFDGPNSEECTTAMSPSSRVSSSLSNPKSLPALPEEPSSPESAPAYDNEELPVASTSQERPTSPVSLSAPAYDDEELPAASTPQERPSSPVKVVPAAPPPPTLVPPPAIKFEAITVPWKGLPLDVALCKQFIPYLPVHCLTS